MKKTALQNAIKRLKKVASKKSTLPILENILNDNGKMTVSTLQVEYTVNVGFEGKFLIDLKQVDKILSKIPASVNIKMGLNGERVYLKTSKGSVFGFIAQNFETFPLFDDCPEEIGSLDNNDIGLIKKAAKFVSDDELRPVMTRIFVSDKIVASDAHRLVYYPYDRKLSSDILIPNEMVGAMNNEKYSVSIGPMFHGNRIIEFAGSDEKIIFRETEGRYPNYRAIIPSKTYSDYEINTKELQECVKLALVSANQYTKLVVFNFKQKTVKISSSDLDFDYSFNQSLNCVPLNKAKNITIGMKGSFLLSLLQDCGETVKIKMVDASKTILIDSDKILMPMMFT